MEISLNGIINSERSFDQAARQVGTVSTPSPQSADSFSLSDDAKAMVSMEQAKLSLQANLRVVSVESNLEQDALNLFA